MYMWSAPTRPWERVYACGNIPELGHWHPVHGLALSKEPDDDSIHSATIHVCATLGQIEYRYFTCQFLNSGKDAPDDMVVVLWEVNLRPRSRLPVLETGDKCAARVELFGTYGGKTQTDDGWLINQTEVRLRLHGDPIRFWKTRHAQRKYRLRVTPVDLRYREMEPGFEAAPLLDDDDSRDACTLVQPSLPSHTRTLLAVLNDATDSSFGDQQSTGKLFTPKKDFFVYKTQSVAVEFLGFLIDFFVDPADQVDNSANQQVDTALRELRRVEGPNPNRSAAAAPVPASSATAAPTTRDGAERVAFCYVLPGNATDTYGSRTIPVTSMRHQPIGQISVDFLLIKPVQLCVQPYLMDVSYARHWKKRQPLNVGHRGMGCSYTKFSIVRENTLHSLEWAGEHGADYVEFDVQLTRDRVPVVYHDFHVNVTISRRWAGSNMDVSSAGNAPRKSPDGGLSDGGNSYASDEDERNLHLHKLSVKDLKLKQLHLLQVTHTSHSDAAAAAAAAAVAAANSPTPQNSQHQDAITLPVPDPTEILCEEGRRRALIDGVKAGGRKWDLTGDPVDEGLFPERQPFPTLSQVLIRVNSEVGFNVEIKYPMLQTDGTWECDHFWERNEYLDAILADVLNHAGSRRILFSSFDPDICIMLKLKQNKYPVLFLSLGKSTRYMPFLDERSSTTMLAVRFVKGAKLLGVNFHSEDLLRDPAPYHLARLLNLVCFIWGDDLDNKETQRYFRDLGLDGIIYDRINESKSLGHRNIFMIEKQVKDALFRSRSRSPSVANMSNLERAVGWAKNRAEFTRAQTNRGEAHDKNGNAGSNGNDNEASNSNGSETDSLKEASTHRVADAATSSPSDEEQSGSRKRKASLPKVVVAPSAAR